MNEDSSGTPAHILPLQYRPREFDDWGVVRTPDGSIFAVARRRTGETDDNEHRKNQTDPYRETGELIIRAVGSHDALIGVCSELYKAACEAEMALQGIPEHRAVRHRLASAQIDALKVLQGTRPVATKAEGAA